MRFNGGSGLAPGAGTQRPAEAANPTEYPRPHRGPRVILDEIDGVFTRRNIDARAGVGEGFAVHELGVVRSAIGASSTLLASST